MLEIRDDDDDDLGVLILFQDYFSHTEKMNRWLVKGFAMLSR